jgi:hypothetical protein
MTDVTVVDVRELGPEALGDPDFPRRGDARPDDDVRFVRTRYRLFKRSRGDGAWVCQCGQASCARRRWTWEELSGAYHLWIVPVADARRVVRVLRAVGVHFGAAPDPCPCECHEGYGYVHPHAPCACRAYRTPDEAAPVASATPAVVSNYSDLSAVQRGVLLLGPVDGRRWVPPTTRNPLIRRGLLLDDEEGSRTGCYLLSEAGLRARRAVVRGEVPDPPGVSAPRAPRTWGAGDPEPREDGLEVVDRDGDVWRRRDGSWWAVEWNTGQSVRADADSSSWAEVWEFAPLTERLTRDPKRARPAGANRPDFREELAELHAVVSQFFTGHASLGDLRRARNAAGRALDRVPGRSQ